MRVNHKETGAGIGGKPPRNVEPRSWFLCRIADTTERARARGIGRNFIKTSALFAQMSATLAEQFEGYAKRCLELARSAKTRAGRARFIQMAHEYRLAALRIHEELSSDQRASNANHHDGANWPSVSVNPANSARALRSTGAMHSTRRAGWDRRAAWANPRECGKPVGRL